MQDKSFDRKYGPPGPIRGKPYSLMLELLEGRANRQLMGEYRDDVTQFMAHLESGSGINPAMIDLQPEIQWFMRPFLLDFLIELHASFRLKPQTLFLCLNIIDRYCAKRIVFKRHYQLVGCTALWISSKYEDKKSRVPTLKELSMMCRHAYDEEMFIQMEMHILSTLDWSLSHSTLEECMQLAIASCDIETHVTPCKYSAMRDSNVSMSGSKLSAVTAVARFLCELSLYDRFFLTIPTSLVSITANLLACAMLQVNNASSALRALLRRNSVEKGRESKCEELNDNNENEQPEVDGPFLSGFDASTLNTLRKICLMFIIELSKITKVLSKKYEELGVIQTVKSFNTRYHFVISAVYENQSLIQNMNPQELETSNLANLADILMQLPYQATDNNNEMQQIPLTPPSATSQYSIFSNKSLTSIFTTPIQTNAAYFPSIDKIEDFSPTGESADSTWSSPVSSKIHVC